MSKTDPRLIVVAEYTNVTFADTDFSDLSRNEDISNFTEFNAALLKRIGNDKPRIEQFEASTLRGLTVGLAAGAMIGLVFPPAALGVLAAGSVGGLLGAAAGGLIGHSRHGEDEAALKVVAESLPEDRAIILVSTTDLDALTRVKVALDGADQFFSHIHTNETNLAETIAADTSTPTKSEPTP